MFGNTLHSYIKTLGFVNAIMFVKIRQFPSYKTKPIK